MGRNLKKILSPGIFLFILILTITVTGFAQVKNKGIPFIINHTKKEYQAGTQNWDIIQADNNILYVANSQGVMRYNGLNWELIPMPNRSIVRCLFKDVDNVIYVGAYNEFGYLVPDSLGRLVYTSLKEEIPDLETGEIWGIQRKGDFLYFQSYNHLLVYNSKLNVWSVLEPDDTFGFLHESEGVLYINNRWADGLMTLDKGLLKPIEGGEFFAEREIWAIMKSSGTLLVGTQNDGVFTIRNGNVEEWDSPVNNELKLNKLYSFEETDDNFFWGTIQDGLIVTDIQGNIVNHLNKKSGLNNNTVLSLLIDIENNIWLGLDSGIDQICIHSPLSLLKTENDIGAGYCAEVYDDKVYLGTNQGLFWVPYSMQADDPNEVLRATKLNECSGQVWSLKVVGDELLVAHNRGAFSIRNNSVEQIYDKTGVWNFVHFPGRMDKLLVGTYTGLTIFEKGISGVEFLNSIERFDKPCRTIFTDDDQVVWIGHGYEGIYRIVLDNDFTEVIDQEVFNENSGLGTSNFNELLKVDNHIMVGNSEAVFHYNSSINDFEVNTDWSKVFSNEERLTKVYERKANDLFYFQEETGGQLHFFSDTLLKDESVMALINQSYIPPFQNITEIHANEFLIGTDNGFTHLDLDIKTVDQEDFELLFISYKSLRKNSKINMWLEYCDNLDEESKHHPLSLVPFRDNDVRVTFSATYLTDPGQTKYQYLLEGEMLAWSDWSSDTEIDFTNLREGKYNLRVKAKNLYGRISDESQLYFHINTPWYRSLIAYLSYVIFVIMAVYIAWRLWNNRLEREKRRSKLLEERRMFHKQLSLKQEAELAEKEIVKLRNDKLRADIRNKSKQLANQTMGVRQKNEFLTEIKDEMARVKKSAQSGEVISFMNRMIRKIDRNIEDEDTHRIFETNFDQVHENFLQRLQESYPNLTAKDLRLCAYLRMNLSSKEIAPLLNISIRGVEISRYRLRRKMELEHSENLADYILKF